MKKLLRLPIYVFLALIPIIACAPLAVASLYYLAGDNLEKLPIVLTVTSAILLFVAFKPLFITVKRVGRIKKILTSRGYSVKKANYAFSYGAVVAEGRDTVINVIYLNVKKKRRNYHFSEVDQLEIYKTTSAMAKAGRNHFVRLNPVTSMTGAKQLSHHEYSGEKNEQKYIVMSKRPIRVTHSRGQEELFNGDKICRSDVLIYDYKGFTAHINKV